MGVMSCSRKDCDNIMCSTYIPDIGYLCSDCKREFENMMEKHHISSMKEGDLIESLKTFRDAPAKNTEIITIDEFFNKYTK